MFYRKVYDNVNSLSHRSDFVRACLDMWERHSPFGTYNLTNPGAVTTRQVVAKIQRILKPDRTFEFWQNDEEFYQSAAQAPRSNCILDVSKLLAAGIQMRSVQEALDDALQHWQPAGPSITVLADVTGADSNHNTNTPSKLVHLGTVEEGFGRV